MRVMGGKGVVVVVVVAVVVVVVVISILYRLMDPKQLLREGDMFR